MPFGQFASTTQFYLYGTRQCTQTGWKAASDVYPQPDILQTDLSLEDKVYIVTGANGGIGFEITSNLAKRKATVYMICRSRERAEKAREQIVTTTANPNVHVIIADCARQRDVRYAWEEFVQHRLSLGESPQLHGLLCNAGGLSNDLTVTDEGIETTFAAHLLFGTYLLTKLALQTLEATPDSRVVVVSSGGMYNTKWPAWEIGTSQSGTYDGQLAYAYAKRGQVLLCEQWTQMFATSGVKFVTSHPGWVDTDGVTAAYGEKKKYLEPMRNLWEGSEGIIWLLVVDRREIEGGAFYLDRTPRVKHMAGPFFTEGSFTKNTPEEVKSLMTGLEIWSELQGPPEPFPTGPLVAMQAPIDIPRYMGKWYVHANIPTYFDKDTINNTEDYVWNDETKSVEVSFKYNAINSTDVSEVQQLGKIENQFNTEWSLSVKLLIYLPVPMRYLLLTVNEGLDPAAASPSDPYQSCMIGVPDRSALWIMTRTAERMSDEDLAAYSKRARSLGYDTSRIVRVPFVNYSGS